MRLFIVPILAGLVASLTAGAGARLVMRIVALMAHQLPDFTWPGTTRILVVGVILGLAPVCVYTVAVVATSDSAFVRRHFHDPLRRGVAFGFLILLVCAILSVFIPILPPEDVRLGFPLLNYFMFALLPLVFGVTLGGAEAILDRCLSGRTSGHRGSVGAGSR